MINCWSDCWSRFTCYIINKLYVLQAKQRIIRTHPLLVINFIKSIYSSYDYSHAIDRSLGQFLSPSICTSDPRPAVITSSENLQPRESLQRVIILAKTISCLTAQTAIHLGSSPNTRRFLWKTGGGSGVFSRENFICFSFSVLQRDAAVLFSLTSMLVIAFIIHRVQSATNNHIHTHQKTKTRGRGTMPMLARHSRTCHLRHTRTEIMWHLSTLSLSGDICNPHSRVYDSYMSPYEDTGMCLQWWIRNPVSGWESETCFISSNEIKMRLNPCGLEMDWSLSQTQIRSELQYGNPFCVKHS